MCACAEAEIFFPLPIAEIVQGNLAVLCKVGHFVSFKSACVCAIVRTIEQILRFIVVGQDNFALFDHSIKRSALFDAQFVHRQVFHKRRKRFDFGFYSLVRVERQSDYKVGGHVVEITPCKFDFSIAVFAS